MKGYIIGQVLGGFFGTAMIAALLPYDNYLDYEFNSLGTIIISKEADFFSIFSAGAIGGTLVYLSFLLAYKSRSKGNHSL